MITCHWQPNVRSAICRFHSSVKFMLPFQFSCQILLTAAHWDKYRYRLENKYLISFGTLSLVFNSSWFPLYPANFFKLQPETLLLWDMGSWYHDGTNTENIDVIAQIQDCQTMFTKYPPFLDVASKMNGSVENGGVCLFTWKIPTPLSFPISHQSFESIFHIYHRREGNWKKSGHLIFKPEHN